MSDNNREQRICKTCNRPFSISDEELAWLKERGLKPFTHCSACRKARREQNKEKRNNNGK